MFNRRKFLDSALKSLGSLAIGRSDRSVSNIGAPCTVKLRGTAPVSVPENFIGLGYEMSSVATPGLLSVGNRRYINLVKGLGTTGVIRVGGIVADYTRYEPNGGSRWERQHTVISRADLERFGEFLKETGWKAIWSVNFAQGSKDDALVEARAVADVIGERLLALELGNEVENYARGEKPFRAPGYDFDKYHAEYSEWHAAIHNALPGIRFAAPDTASSIEWVERMAAGANGDVQLLTTHYYRGGQKDATVEQLIHPDPRLKDVLERLHTVSEHSGIPWRMCETNSFFGGGRPGISDTFLAALWTLDYMLMLAQYGCSGVNIETGVNQLGFVSSYSPIQDDLNGINSAGVPYYGMLAFATAIAGCNQVLPIDCDAQNINMTAYVLGKDARPSALVVINKDNLQDAKLSRKNLGFERAFAFRLKARSLDSKLGIMFGGSAVDPNGLWKAGTIEETRDGIVSVPRASALVLRIQKLP